MTTTALSESVQERVADALSPFRKRLADTRVPPFEVKLLDGTVHRLVGGSYDGPQEARFRLTMQQPGGLTALLAFDEVQLALAFLQGDLDVEGDFLSCLDLRVVLTDRHPIQSANRYLKPLLFGQKESDKSWVPKHYDHGNDFYFAFLDKTYRLYSQALYTRDDESLDQAARNKLEYIFDVCRLKPGSHILNVGAGWASLENFIGPRGVSSTMLTLSHEQFEFLTQLSKSHDYPAKLKVVKESIFAYQPGEQYDAITLLGVMEHLPDYEKLFKRFAMLLKPGGRLYMDFAANRNKFSVSSFTHRFVFEGNHTPVFLPGLLDAGNKAGFEPIALHNDRHSYYLTLQAWARNLEAARDKVVPMVGEKVYRLFRLYLWGGAQQLQRTGRLESYRVVFQRSWGRPSEEIGCYRPV